MRGKFFYVALLGVLTGSLASPAISQTGATPKKTIPPHLAKECAAKVNSQFDGSPPLPGASKTNPLPLIVVVGPFSEVSFASPLARWAASERVLVIAAPTFSRSIHGSGKTYSGCIYDIRDGTLVFREVAGPPRFPIRKVRVPGDPS